MNSATLIDFLSQARVPYGLVVSMLITSFSTETGSRFATRASQRNPHSHAIAFLHARAHRTNYEERDRADQRHF
jgi:hypothetical protein